MLLLSSIPEVKLALVMVVDFFFFFHPSIYIYIYHCQMLETNQLDNTRQICSENRSVKHMFVIHCNGLLTWHPVQYRIIFKICTVTLMQPSKLDPEDTGAIEVFILYTI